MASGQPQQQPPPWGQSELQTLAASLAQQMAAVRVPGPLPAEKLTMTTTEQLSPVDALTRPVYQVPRTRPITQQQRNLLLETVPAFIIPNPVIGGEPQRATAAKRTWTEMADQKIGGQLTRLLEITGAKAKRIRRSAPDIETCFLNPLPLVSTERPTTALPQVDINALYTIDQAQIYSRVQIQEQIQSLLSPLGQKCNNKDLSKILNFKRLLGSGTYGTVCEVQYKNTEQMPWPFALKRFNISPMVSKSQREGDLQQIYREVFFARKTSELVTFEPRMYACPNFALYLHQCGSTQNSDFRQFIDLFTEAGSCVCDEKAKSALQKQGYGCHISAVLSEFAVEYITCKREKHLSECRHIEHVMMSIIFQVLVALLWMGVVLDMAHNDLKTTNVIYNTVPPETIYRYQIDAEHIYNVRTFGILAKIIDFSWSTSDWFSKFVPEHSTIYDFSFSEGIFDYAPDDYANIGSGKKGHKHVLYYKFLNTYARDIFGFIGEIRRRPSFPNTVRSWADNVLRYMIGCMEANPSKPTKKEPRKNSAFTTVRDLLTVFKIIFSKKFLADNDLPDDIFDPIAQEPTAIFVLPSMK